MIIVGLPWRKVPNFLKILPLQWDETIKTDKKTGKNRMHPLKTGTFPGFPLWLDKYLPCQVNFSHPLRERALLARIFAIDENFNNNMQQ